MRRLLLSSLVGVVVLAIALGSMGAVPVWFSPGSPSSAASIPPSGGYSSSAEQGVSELAATEPKHATHGKGKGNDRNKNKDETHGQCKVDAQGKGKGDKPGKAKSDKPNADHHKGNTHGKGEDDKHSRPKNDNQGKDDKHSKGKSKARVSDQREPLKAGSKADPCATDDPGDGD